MMGHEEEYEGFTIKIEPDENPMNPRTEWDNVATMVCFHGRYNLGDKNHGFNDPQEVEDYLEENKNTLEWLPLFLYDHSGITMNTTGFSCPWDSGQVGVIYVSKEKSKEEWGIEDKAEIEKRLRGEVEVYDMYLRGAFVGFVVKDEDGEEIDSCWGFDDQDCAIEEAKMTISGEINHRKETDKFHEMTFAL